jgi:S-adenosylmethionine-diacylgycerolhomoserine-N-methlytransferase
MQKMVGRRPIIDLRRIPYVSDDRMIRDSDDQKIGIKMTTHSHHDTKTSDHPIIRSSDHLSDVTRAMNSMYRYTRHVYDASRKFYLLGRDRLIRELALRPDEVVIEAGCGTARNLIKMARAYPGARFYGFDASEEMLKTARDNVARAGLADRITLAHGFAQNFDPRALFNLDPARIDRIVFSYALSMIPPWRESVDHALSLIQNNVIPAQAGISTPHEVAAFAATTSRPKSIHIVDFGSQEGLPAWFRAFLFWWLDLFGVHFRPELPVYIASLSSQNLRPQITQGLKGYYWMAKVGG